MLAPLVAQLAAMRDHLAVMPDDLAAMRGGARDSANPPSFRQGLRHEGLAGDAVTARCVIIAAMGSPIALEAALSRLPSSRSPWRGHNTLVERRPAQHRVCPRCKRHFPGPLAKQR